MGNYLIGYPNKSYPRLTYFGYSDEQVKFDTGVHWHLGYEFVYFYNGAAFVTINEGEPPVFVSDDDLLITAPDVPHTFSLPDVPRRFAWIGVQTGDTIADVADEVMFPPSISPDRLPQDQFRFYRDEDTKITAIGSSLPKQTNRIIRKIPEAGLVFQQIGGEIFHPRNLSKEYISIKLMELLTIVLRRLQEQEDPSGTSRCDIKQTVLQYVADFIRTHLQERITLPLLGEKAGYQPAYLSRIFSEYFGTSPIRFLQQCRIQRARELLAAGFSVSAAAEESGFTDVHYFCSVFKKETGMTPGQYRGPVR